MTNRTTAVDGPPQEAWAMIEQSVRHVFDETSEGSGGHCVVGERLAELGWADIEAEYSVAATQLLFCTRARTLTQTDCLDRVMLAELGAALSRPADRVILPAGAADCSGDGTTIEGIVLGPAHGVLAFGLAQPSGVVLTGTVDAAHLRCEPLDTFDASSTWTRVTGTVSAELADGAGPWRRAMAAGRRALATELVTLAEQMLDTAVDHVRTRAQFGSPIGAYQAPRHALADACARLEGARALTAEAWRHGDDLRSLIAKAVAGRVHRQVADVSIQVSGAIGLTMEHHLHRYVARGMQLDTLLGTHRRLESALAERLLSQADRAGPLPDVISCA